MTPHERFTACMHFEPVDHAPLYEFDPWAITLRRWQGEALGEGNPAPQYTEPDYDPWVKCIGYLWMLPRYKVEVLEETDGFVTSRMAHGVIKREFKSEDEWSMPEWLSHPVKTRDDWRRIKKLFDPSHPERMPADWAASCTRWRDEGPVLIFQGFRSPSLFGFVRELMGFEEALKALYDEPTMVHDMMETMTELVVSVLKRVTAEAPLSMFFLYCDICYRNGPLVSPKMIREFMVPRYRRMTDAARAGGVDILILDSDGEVTELIPLVLEAGFNGIYPLQQCSEDMNPLKIRKKYGRDLVLTGGIDKNVLATTREAIDEELAIKMPLVEQGGYIPFSDHHLPYNISYENFTYYWQKKKQWLGLV